MATGKIRMVINPPDVVNKTRTTLTSGVITPITSAGGWYSVEAQTRETSGECQAYLGDQSLTTYYAAIDSGTGTFKRACTPWIYFPKGATFSARCFFTASDRSGLNFAEPLD